MFEQEMKYRTGYKYSLILRLTAAITPLLDQIFSGLRGLAWFQSGLQAFGTQI